MILLGKLQFMGADKLIRDVVIITDCKDVAFCEMRRQILSECEKLGNNYTRVEPLVAVEEFSIINGAFLARLMVEQYQRDVLFMLILNPLMRRPKRIFGKLTNGFFFEGADTGTLNWLFDDFGIESVYEIKEETFFPFGGKYIHSPVVAKMASGVSFNEYGRAIRKDELCDFTIADGAVVHVDNFGLIKIKATFPDLREGTRVRIFVNGRLKVEASISKRMMSLETGTWALYPGSSLGLPELGKVRCKNGAAELGVKVGDSLTWKQV